MVNKKGVEIVPYVCLSCHFDMGLFHVLGQEVTQLILNDASPARGPCDPSSYHESSDQRAEPARPSSKARDYLTFLAYLILPKYFIHHNIARRIRVRFRRGSLRNGYHIQGRQQARKLPNPDTGR